jgi:hypothetical protein
MATHTDLVRPEPARAQQNTVPLLSNPHSEDQTELSWRLLWQVNVFMLNLSIERGCRSINQRFDSAELKMYTTTEIASEPAPASKRTEVRT